MGIQIEIEIAPDKAGELDVKLVSHLAR